LLGRPGISWRIVLAVSLTASVLPCAVHAASWSIGAGGGVVGPYVPTEGSNEFSSIVWMPFASASRGLNRTLWLRSEVVYFGYSGGHSGHGDTNFQLPPGPPEVRFLPVALGVRWQAPPGGSGISPYLEFMPTAFVVRWEQTTYGNFTRVVPGFTTGAGFHLHGNDSWSLSYGFQLRHSAQILEEWPPGAREGLDPLTNLSFTLGVAWRTAAK